MNKILIPIFLIIIFLCYYYVNNYGMVSQKSALNNKVYIVRNMHDSQHAADILANIELNYIKLIDYLKTNNQDQKKYVDRLINKISRLNISEKPEYYYGTSYSLEKGKSIVFCIRDINDKLHDMNVIMYVALHELSHIACPEYGHDELFREIFYFITKSAIEIGLYHPINFSISPVNYCGLTITSSII